MVPLKHESQFGPALWPAIVNICILYMSEELYDKDYTDTFALKLLRNIVNSTNKTISLWFRL